MTDPNMEHDREARALLARALKNSGKSARKASEKMQITDTRLRHIINGYQPIGRGERIPVFAPTDTMANIALALDITPDAMAEAGRVDVARAMSARLRETTEGGGSVDAREWTRILAEHDEIREWAEDGLEVYMPPDSILRMFDDTQLLAEVLRRMRETATAESLSGGPDRQDFALAAHDEDESIAGEQEKLQEP